MENNNSEITWGSARNHVLVWFLLVMIALVMSMCGTRSAGLKKTSSLEKTEQAGTSIGSTTKVEGKSNESSNKEKNSKKDENVIEKTEKVYNENGTIQKETTTKETKRSQERSSKESRMTITEHKRVDSNFNVTNYKTVYKKESEKDKQTTADKSFVANVGGWGVVIAIVVIIVGGLFAWAYFKPKIPRIKK